MPVLGRPCMTEPSGYRCRMPRGPRKTRAGSPRTALTKPSTPLTEIPTIRSGKLSRHTNGYTIRAMMASGRATTAKINHSRNATITSTRNPPYDAGPRRQGQEVLTSLAVRIALSAWRGVAHRSLLPKGPCIVFHTALAAHGDRTRWSPIWPRCWGRSARNWSLTRSTTPSNTATTASSATMVD